MKYPDIKFLCRKCEQHLAFVGKNEPEKIARLAKTSCPSCGEEGTENWILIGPGNYNVEFKRVAPPSGKGE